MLSEKYFEDKKIKLEHFSEEFKNVIELIGANAPVKIIIKNKNEEQIIEIFNEIVEENRKIDLREKIESLEHKVSLNLDENLYSELLLLHQIP